MKKTRLVALVALVVVCIAGWAILVLNTMNEVKTQQNTVEAAQYYRGKKLFQLSLQNYQSAIAEKPTEALYDEYLAACAEYYEDCPTRNVRNTEESAYASAVAAYPERADYWEKYAAIYYEDGDYDTVVDVLKSADAAKVSFNDTMMQYWNEAYYACETSAANYESLAPAGMDGVYDDAGKFAHFRRTGADAKVINGLGTGRAVIHFAAGFLHQVVNDALLALGHDVPGFLQDHAAVHQQRQFGNHVGKLHHALFAALFKLVAHLICTVGIDDGHHCHTGD